MTDDFLQEFNQSLLTGFVDKDANSEVLFQPKLLVNSKNPKKKVLTSILKEFNNCESFKISVAFVTTGGVATIINTLQALEEKNIQGEVLVSQYLNFTQPEALERLLQFKNIDLRIATKNSSHSKGYIFKTSKYYNLIIGSSNLTQSALASNKEWNLQVSALKTSDIADKVISEFNKDFEVSTKVTHEYILAYRDIYSKQRLLSKSVIPIQSELNLEPNQMQSEALDNLKKIRKSNKDKALIISATGTGKTYLAAFDVKQFAPKKILFVVHRLNIAKTAMSTFQKVFGPSKKMGLYSGNRRELDNDFIFSTVQTISKKDHLGAFKKDHFDYIIIDESHRSGAQSYQNLIDYFTPKFLLGMTATPERTDGNDIFKLYDYNIAYEIRLNQAMEEEMLSPFHYYGVSDLTIDDSQKDDLTEFNYLTSEERVLQIINKANFYGSDNGITRGLIFCNRNEEAQKLSEKLNKSGLRTLALSGNSSDEERSLAIQKLESDSISQKIDYILTVNIFNEGIDIPKVNQIILLRPTESAIVFIQQLGRGLRKADEKSYLTVIDFIGNYNNNYLIPIALYGDSSYNKDRLRKLISEGSRETPGTSTINFDRISKEKIFQSIDNANMKLLKELKEDYNYLKNRLGKTPMMMDFIETKTRDPFLFIEYSRSYFNFVNKVESDKIKITESASLLLEYFSKEINNGKRIEESIILEYLINDGETSVLKIQQSILDKFDISSSINTIQSAIDNLNFKFIREKQDKKLLSVNKIHKTNLITINSNKIVPTTQFKESLKEDVFKSFLIDNTLYSVNYFKTNHSKSKWNDGFSLYSKYSRKDVFRILNYAYNPVAQNVGGYMVNDSKTNCPIFVNYHKEDDISESTKYEDEFINNSTFSWMSKSNRKIDSKDVQSILGKHGDIRLPLFIKKNKDQNDFYYMGDVTAIEKSTSQGTMKNNSGKLVSVVKVSFKMKTPVSDSMYNYLLERRKKETTAPKVIQLKSQIPLYNFHAAAGSFSELQTDKSFDMIDAPEQYNKAGYFACEIKGESMNRRIPNGSLCIFKEYQGGSRNGKIVLVENLDFQDSDFNSAFTIKTYTSEIEISDDTWEHRLIKLKPNSFDSSYKDIVITEENAENMRILGEFISIL
jgi:superfamily II DNA or RNA helicase/phage repressor protein C with HTH and peptisase S24 domain